MATYKRVKTTDYGLVSIFEAAYSNGRVALQLVKGGELIATLTVNLPEHRLEKNEFFVKTWSENERIAGDCLVSGLFIDTGKRIRTEYVTASVWRFA